MKTLKERAELYNAAYPQYAKLCPVYATEHYLFGWWLIGNFYKNKTKYYGAYPHSYLDRMKSMFPEFKGNEILHLFSGSLDKEEGIKFDYNEALPADVYGDAHNLSEYFDAEEFSIVYADPPYSQEDALRYGKPMVNRNEVVSQAAIVLRSGGFLIWLDQVYPMYRKKVFNLVGKISITRSTNHRERSAFIFQKQEPHISEMRQFEVPIRDLNDFRMEDVLLESPTC